jgi:hypothetical protein
MHPYLPHHQRTLIVGWITTQIYRPEPGEKSMTNRFPAVNWPVRRRWR